MTHDAKINTAARPPSRQVDSNQSGPHHRLVETVQKHLTTPFQKPVQAYNRDAFAALEAALAHWGGPWMLDAGCGTGDSTRALAVRHPGHLIIGVDKSLHRLTKERTEPDPGNMALIRADLVDLWRLIADAGLRPERHSILYPNPWPKAEHLQRRWHGHSVFPYILKIGAPIELRTNWQTYAEEFQIALDLAGIEAGLRDITDAATADPLTPFEAKYTQSGQQVWGVYGSY